MAKETKSDDQKVEVVKENDAGEAVQANQDMLKKITQKLQTNLVLQSRNRNYGFRG